jgi:hypothetical protein
MFWQPAFKVQEQLPKRPEPELVNGEEPEYEVKEVLTERTSGDRTEYLIQWEGYGLEDDTWELISNLKNAKGALWDFKA